MDCLLSVSQMSEKKKTMGSCPEQDRPSIRASVEQGFFKSQFTTAQGMTFMASAEREPITGVWGQCLQRGPGGRAPGGGSGGLSPLKLNAFLLSHAQRKPQI